MAGPVVVGIDAGGSKTRAFAVDRDGAVIGRGAGGGANLLSSPDPAGSIGAALAESLGGARPEAVVLSCSGGDRPADREKGRTILRQLVGPEVRLEVTHDAIAALYAGNPVGCGVVLIAGTGSIAFGRNDEGEELRAGGWGHLIGDEGSGVWLGLEGLRAAAHHTDGRGAPTAITAHLLRELHVQSFMDVIPQVYGRPHPAPAIIGAVWAVGRAAAEMDAIAVSIVQRGAHALARATSTVASGLRLTDGPIYLAGGAFESVPSLERAVRSELLAMLPRATVEPVREEPAMGAARLAMRLAWGA
ncbi:MAG TPA: BadF/BadG/BcrA/BcrD ATPase family protein [Candidatus Limnocylindria bacterium]|jgi:N-acetylglucosamine kinase-like BadF-type ATPase|nr:BadF/BadG/BcrA/BcrD ATPase family protein [Candidatus Limnocylindria bacterium]